MTPFPAHSSCRSALETLDANERQCFGGNVPNRNGRLAMKRKQYSVGQIVAALSGLSWGCQWRIWFGNGNYPSRRVQA